MTREDIKQRMADAGLKAPAQGDFIFIHWDQIAMLLDYEREMRWTQAHWTEYEHNLVAAEREACAKLCDEVEGRPEYLSVAKLCAAAIRARGQQ